MTDLTERINTVVQLARGSVVLEAAHFYADQGPDERVLAGAHVAVNLLSILYDFHGVGAVKMLFVDDVVNKSSETHGGMHFGDIVESSIVPAAISILSSIGYVPDTVVLESHLVKEGDRNIQYLLGRGKAIVHKGTLKLKGGNDGLIPLQGKAGNLSIPACEVLDATLYQHKLGRYGGAITVLPQGYQQQQDKTRLVYQAITGVSQPNVLVVYHNPRAEIVDMHYWGVE